MINPAASSTQNRSCSTARCAPGLPRAFNRLLLPCQAQLAEGTSTCVEERCHFTRGNERQMSDHTWQRQRTQLGEGLAAELLSSQQLNGRW